MYRGGGSWARRAPRPAPPRPHAHLALHVCRLQLTVKARRSLGTLGGGRIGVRSALEPGELVGVLLDEDLVRDYG